MISNCTHCGAQYQLPDKMLGKQARCKACKRLFVIVPKETEVDLPEPTGSTAQMSPVNEEEDGLDALASAASGSDMLRSPRESSRPTERDEPPRGRRRVAKGAGSAMGMGITAAVLAFLGVITGLIMMLSTGNTSIVVAFGSVTAFLLGLSAILGMVAVANANAASRAIRRSRYPMAGKSQATTGTILGLGSVAVVFIMVIVGGIWLAKTDGIQFTETRDQEGNVVYEDANTAIEGGAAAGAFTFACMFVVVGLAMFGFWLWMLIDCCVKEFPDGNKAMWLVIIILTGCLGALIYLFAGRPKPPRRRISERQYA